MSTVLAFLKKAFGNRWVQLGTVGLLLLGLGYSFGRYAQPAKVIEKEKIVTQVVTKVEYQDRIVEKIVQVKEKEQARHTETTTTKKPDGTETTTTVTDTKTDTKTDTNTDKSEEKIVYKDRVVTQVVEKEKIVEGAKPSWRLGADVGLSIPSTFLGDPQIGVPGLRGAVVGIGAERRIFGPLWFALRGNTQGTVSIGLAGEF